MLCSELHRQKYFELEHISFQISTLQVLNHGVSSSGRNVVMSGLDRSRLELRPLLNLT